ncbi:MAG: prepilin-type N-terminal cleavage/methylation domain-containing protein [Candidatus Microsaccharimonas sp.]
MRKTTTGFTIVELLIVVVVIAILASITIISYNGIQAQAIESSLKSDLKGASTQLGLDKARTDNYPTSLAKANQGKGISLSDDTSVRYVHTQSNDSYCLMATSKRLSTKTFSIDSSNGSMQAGGCGSVWLTRGSTTGSCSPQSCYRINVNTANFTAGSYSVRCLYDGSYFSSAAPYTFPAFGVTQLTCYTQPDSQKPIGIEIAGWGTVEQLPW